MTLHPHRPAFTEQDAAALAAARYRPLHLIRSLPSYDDQNFYLEDDAGRGYVLKIASAAAGRDVLAFQNEAMLHVAARLAEALCPQVVPSRDGHLIEAVTAADGARHFVRLVTYLPGTLLARVNPHTPALLADVGAALARLDTALADFTHPAMHRALPWDLKRAGEARSFLPYIQDPERRALAERFLTRYDEAAAPLLPDLRHSVIHNDANDYNILVRGTGLAPRRVAGVIDFGDMVYTCTVCEPAIAATYAMLDKPDPLAVAGHVVRGYHAVNPLTEEELEVVFPLIGARLAVSVCLSAYRTQQEPEEAYLAVSEAPAWAMLEALDAVPPPLAHYRLRAACGLEPCPRTPAVRAWLRQHGHQAASVIQPDVRTTTSRCIDLSVGSLDLGMLDDAGDVATTAALLFGFLQAQGATVGVGRYNEARIVYASEQFQVAGAPDGERRSIHLGIDLFQPAGAPIYAPLDATVHSVSTTDMPLDYGTCIILQHDVADGVTFYTLYGHLSTASGEGLVPGQRIRRGEAFATLGAPEENGGWVPHLHLQLITDLLDASGTYLGVAPPSQRPVWLSLSPDPNLLLGIPEDVFPAPDRTGDDLQAARRRHLGPSLSLSYQQPLTIVRGSGAYLFDAAGRPYLDGVNNVCHVGHCHPHVVRAGQRQMAVLNTNTRYLHENLVRYAERLTGTLPAPLSVCYFVNSGSEANDLALRLAQAYTGGRGVVCLEGAYHGNLSSTVAISPYKFDGPGGRGAAAHVVKAMAPDPYRGPHRGASAGVHYAGAVQEALEALQAREVPPAAFIAESVLSCGGQIVLPEGYLAAAYAHARAAAALCIADEVQVGFGRVGSHFWAFETQGVMPDIVTMGKPMGNGHPMAAVVTTPEVAAAFDNGMEYFNTFGGNPVSCAIGMAVLDVLASEGLQAHAQTVGAYLKAGLEALMAEHTLIGDVRGLGLFLGVELVTDRATRAPAAAQATYLVNRMRAHGILLSTDGPLHNVIKIKPPLVFSQDDAGRLLHTLAKVLAEDPLQPA